MAEKIIVLCVDGVYVKDGKILLLKRNVEPFRGFWHVAGGHVKANETPEEALRREFKEETNLTVTIGGILGSRVEESCDRVKIILTLQVTYARGEIKLNEESTEHGWFTQMPRDSVYDYSEYL